MTFSPARTRSLTLLVIAAAVGTHAVSMWNGLVYDDHFQVLGNRWISDLGNLPKAFSTGVWEFEGGTSNYYRPMMHVLYMLTYKVSGLAPWGYHLVNILVHAAASALVFLVALELLGRSRGSPSSAGVLALAAGLVFAAHPVETESVAWVACVPELSFTALYLLSLLLYSRAERMRTAAFVGSVAAYFASMFCKETAITLPAILVAYDLAFARERRPLELAKRYVPYALAAVAYTAIRFAVIPAIAPITRHATLTTYQNLINIFPLLAKYIGKLFWPTQLNAFHVLHPILSLGSPRGILPLLATLALVTAAALAFFRYRPVFFALSLMVVPLLPVLYIPFVGENTFTERYLYLPTAGFALIVAFGVAWVQRKRPRWSRHIAALLTVLVAGYSLASVRRDLVWRSDESLWTDTVAKSSDSSFARNELGIAYMDRGLDAPAVEQFEEALRLNPESASAHTNLATVLERAGRLDEAIWHYRRAIEANPRLRKAYNNLGNAYAARELPQLAVQTYLAALQLDPDAFESFETRLNLGNVYDKLGRRDEAMEQYQTARRLRPDSADVYLHIGIAYGEAGDLDRAIDNLRAAARLSPSDPLIHRNLAQAYRLKGDMAEANEELKRAKVLER